MSGLIPWRLYVFIVGLTLVVILINISSIFIEDPVGDRDFADWEPWLWEGSSAFSTCLLAPVLYLLYRRSHWLRLGLPRFLMIQAVVCVLFSLCHVAIMVAIRVMIYDLAGSHYDFAQGNLALQLIYEGRKDALGYATTLAIFWGYDRLMTSPQSKSKPEKLEVKTDGRTLYLTPDEIIYAEAAGNYVELHLAGNAKPLLLRGTLGQYEASLEPYGFVRVHRSRLINRSHLRSFESTPSGDLRLTLGDGRQLAGSRRFRDRLG